MPSWRASRRAVAAASSSPTATISSIRSVRAMAPLLE